MKNEIRSWALIFINFRGGTKANYKLPKLIKRNEEKQAGPNPDLNATEGSLGGAKFNLQHLLVPTKGI